ncbi:MAG TPA: HTTM domain-containing protein [Polyangiaceae bacterium]|nr:HTTM domain-containing protein [Polyangiaceae bacterium]
MIARWVDLWDERETAESLALVRILIALSVLGDLLQARMRSAVEAVWAPPPFGAAWGASAASPPLLVSWFGTGAQTAHVAWWLAVVATLLVLLGLAFRVSGWLLVFAMVEMWRLTPDGGDGIDLLLRVVLPLLALSGANATWSCDAWLGRLWGKPLRNSVPAWPRYLLIVQLLWLYFSAAHHRGKASWGPAGGFSAVADVLGDPHFARFFPGSLQAFYPLTQLGTALTMVFEYSAPLALLWIWLDKRPGRGGRFGDWVRRLHVRWWWLALGVSLHLGIAVTMQIGMFPFAILALYPALFGPEEVTKLLKRVRQSSFVRQS